MTIQYEFDPGDEVIIQDSDEDEEEGSPYKYDGVAGSVVGMVTFGPDAGKVVVQFANLNTNVFYPCRVIKR